jgi:pimeloyl-ACP methyl ester carboxylesterase
MDYGEKNIIYVHGASSTSTSFNYIAQNLPEHNRINFEYDCRINIEKIVEDLYNFIPDTGDYNLISHSLGGIIATGVTYLNKDKKKSIRKVVTMSTPFGGSKIATYLRWFFPRYGLFDNVAEDAPLIMMEKRRGAITPTLNIVTDGGETPIMREKNDGVVSVLSQLMLKNVENMKVFNLNHFEVLLDPQVVEAVKEFIW